MVAYNFQARFADAVASGAKVQTIRPARAGRSRHAQPGERLQLYTGLRTPTARKLITPDPVCVLSTHCHIRSDEVGLGNHPPTPLDDFARADGFQDWADMRAWFDRTYGLPFIGRLIVWEPAEQESAP